MSDTIKIPEPGVDESKWLVVGPAQVIAMREEIFALRQDRDRLTTFLTMLQTDFHATPMWNDGAWCIPRLMDGAGGSGGGVVYDRYESFTAAIDAARKS